MSGTVIGLDIGGTKTRGVRFHNGIPVRDESAGSSNVQNVSRKQAAANLAELFGKIGGGQVDEVYVGSGGIDTDEDARALADLIAPHAPGARITVVHDSRLLLAAGGASTGAASTGSAAWGRNDADEEARAGGWGYLLGDEGSGYWLGREAVCHSLRRMNQGLEPDRLSRALLDFCGVEEPDKLIALFHSPDIGRRYWAQRARLVVEAADAGDETSKSLVEQAGRDPADLADLAEQAVRQLGLDGPVILGGGLGMNVPRLQEAIKAKLAEDGIADVRILQLDPVFGVPRLVAEQRD